MVKPMHKIAHLQAYSKVWDVVQDAVHWGVFRDAEGKVWGFDQTS